MKSIKKFGFLNDYYLTEQGLIYDDRRKKYIKPYKDHCFKLKLDNGNQKTISLKSLYKMVFKKVYCIDNICSLQGEVWKPIKGTDEYFISNYSRIISYKGYEAILLKSWSNKQTNGYLTVKITINNKTKNYKVHRLVAEAFLQIPKDIDNYQIHHKDGNRYNNNVQNLQWLTKEQHRKKHEQKKDIQ